MAKCARCNKEIVKGQRFVADPCCAAPDCENGNNLSHFKCLPPYLQRIELDD